MKPTTALKHSIRLAIRARGGFGTAEEIAWQASRTVESRRVSLYHRKLAAVSRSLHVQLNLADTSADLLLPDPSPDNCPASLWLDIDRAARELDLRMPCPAMALAGMALRGQLDSGRIEVASNSRSIVGIPNVAIPTDERAWIETYGPALEEIADQPRPTETSPLANLPPREAPAAAVVGAEPSISDDELTQYAAVLKAMRRGKARVPMTVSQIYVATRIYCARIEEILTVLLRAGRVRYLRESKQWLIVPAAETTR